MQRIGGIMKDVRDLTEDINSEVQSQAETIDQMKENMD